MNQFTTVGFDKNKMLLKCIDILRKSILMENIQAVLNK